ncbi:hypothetical protein [Fodinicola feengrottensis]|nr:hypothetical protein [Fodinicola feengrottensis]
MPSLQGYSALFDRAADGMREAGAFTESEQWRYDWARSYTRDQWLDQLATFGGHGTLSPEQQQKLADGIGAVIDAAGGAFEMDYTAVVVTATRTATPVT